MRSTSTTSRRTRAPAQAAVASSPLPVGSAACRPVAPSRFPRVGGVGRRPPSRVSRAAPTDPLGVATATGSGRSGHAPPARNETLKIARSHPAVATKWRGMLQRGAACCNKWRGTLQRGATRLRVCWAATSSRSGLTPRTRGSRACCTTTATMSATGTSERA